MFNTKCFSHRGRSDFLRPAQFLLSLFSLCSRQTAPSYRPPTCCSCSRLLRVTAGWHHQPGCRHPISDAVSLHWLWDADSSVFNGAVNCRRGQGLLIEIQQCDIIECLSFLSLMTIVCMVHLPTTFSNAPLEPDMIRALSPDFSCSQWSLAVLQPCVKLLTVLIHGGFISVQLFWSPEKQLKNTK